MKTLKIALVAVIAIGAVFGGVYAYRYQQLNSEVAGFTEQIQAVETEEDAKVAVQTFLDNTSADTIASSASAKLDSGDGKTKPDCERGEKPDVNNCKPKCDWGHWGGCFSNLGANILHGVGIGSGTNATTPPPSIRSGNDGSRLQGGDYIESGPGANSNQGNSSSSTTRSNNSSSPSDRSNSSTTPASTTRSITVPTQNIQTPQDTRPAWLRCTRGVSGRVICN